MLEGHRVAMAKDYYTDKPITRSGGSAVSDEPEAVLDIDPSEGNPRNSEGSFARLHDGRIFFAYTHFYGGSADHGAAFIAGRYSYDGGRTWTSEDSLVLENEGYCNVMSVSLFRFQDDTLGMLYLRKDHIFRLCRGFVRRSDDETGSWTSPVLASPRHTYNVINNDRVVRLSGGRLLIPASMHHPQGEERLPGRATCYLSDDDGQSWEMARSEISAPEDSSSGLQEPCVIELEGGRLMMLARTDLGCHYRSYSDDEGVTWSPAEPTDLKTSCVSPASIRRITQTGDILIVFNDASDIGPEYEGKRTPLVTAISDDEGQTWKHRRWLEDDPNGWYCYTAIHFLEDEDTVLLSYCAGDTTRMGGLDRTRITRVPIEWLYG